MIPYDVRYIPKEFGIHRVGLLCYLNAFLQSFLGCSVFNERMLLLEEQFKKKNNELALCYIILLKQSLMGFNEPPTTQYFLKAMITEIQKQKKMYRFDASQQGAHEFMTAFIDVLQDESIEELFSCHVKKRVYCNNCNEFVTDPLREIIMYILLENQIYKYGFNEQQFKKNIHTRSENVPDYTCEKCKLTNTCKIIYQLVRVPEILCIFFYNNLTSQTFTNKQGHQWNTKKTKIYFPPQIHINKKNGGSFHYKPVAMIEHSGTQHGGHYWARVQRKSNTFLCNDQHIEKEDIIPTENTFITFYHYIN